MLLRLALVGALFADGAGRLHDPEFLPILVLGVEVLSGALLSVGLGTRIVATIVCMLELGMLPASHGTIELHLLLAAVSLCVVLMGPGAWSIDAHFFGRRRVEIKRLRDD